MKPFYIILIGIWIYPVISLICFLLTKKRQRLRKRIFYILSALTALTLIGISVNISTTLTTLDWLLVSVVYLTISFALWWTQFQSNKLLKISGFITIIVVFSAAYLMGSIGILGLVFVVGEYTTDYQTCLGNGLVCKESNLGNAVSDYRGEKVEVYRTMPRMPIIEWRIKVKKYDNFIPFGKKLKVQYLKTRHKIYLSTAIKSGKDNHTEYWSDTLTLQ